MLCISCHHNITRKEFQMSLSFSISKSSPIRNFILGLSFHFYFSKPVFHHIEEFIYAAIQIGFRGKLVDIVALSYALCHRTTYGKFLSQGVWNEQFIWRVLQKRAIYTVYKNPPNPQNPIFVIYDDTISAKTKPSSKALCPIAKTSFHQSHLENKQVWGHQMLATLLSVEEKVFPYLLKRYEKGTQSKIEMVCSVAETLPIATRSAYALCDSWYTCEDVIEAHLKRGYHLIGGLKTNRVIYPQGVRIQIKDFAQYIKKNDVHLVTVGASKYWTYRYEGPLKGIANAVVILCWPEKAFQKPKCLHAFLCTDDELSTQTLLEYYSQRWPVEIFFRQTKGNLGLNKYQVRSEIAIDRLLALIAVAYCYCVLGSGDYQKLGPGMRSARINTERDKITCIYDAARRGTPLDDVLAAFKIA
jgi:hypothetical protein